MITHVMSYSINDNVIDEMESHIKIFLTYYEIMDSGMRYGDNINKVNLISSYNFVCLLNLPQQAHMLGPVRHYWEGGGLGENFIQVAKHNFANYYGEW